jgi:MAF protein
MLALTYEVCPSRIDEKAIRDEDPLKLTQKLADAKAWKVALEYPEAIIVSGDAVAARNGKIFEKPHDRQEAVEFLRELSNSEFQFVTALTVLNSGTGRKLSTVEISYISFRNLIEREIQDYVNSYDVLRCAGAFENDAVLRFGERICGSYNFVTAIPVSRLIVFLREHEVAI